LIESAIFWKVQLGEITMENDSKNIKNTPQKDAFRITRRRMFQITAIGTLVAVAGLQIVYRRLKSSNAFIPTEISIEGPFQEYGYFRPEDLGLKAVNKIASGFQLLQIGFSQGTYEDRIALSFTFVGNEAPNRMMKVSVSIYDKEKNIIGGAERILRDTRINVRNVKPSNMEFFEPISALSVSLNKAKNISHIFRIEIVMMEVETTRDFSM
jgi:hypothetical protein